MKEEDIRKRAVFNKYLQLVAEDSRKFFKSDELIRINCPACNSPSYEYAFSKAGFNYVLCKNCGTLFVNPRPSIEKLKEFYASSPSSKFWVERFFKPVAEVRREKIFKPRAKYVLSLFPQLKGKIVGDIGAGFGLFLEELEKLCPGVRLIAIEPSLEMVKICENKGFEVIPDFLENISNKYNNSFFLLTSFELFEHIGEPQTFLKKAFNLLQLGGYLLLTTLNGEGFDIQILWEKSKSVFPPHHLNFFNPTSISILFRKVGFKIKEIATPGKLDWDILEGAYKKEGINIGRFWQLLADKGTKQAKQALQNWISSYGFSSHMRVLAQKT